MVANVTDTLTLAAGEMLTLRIKSPQLVFLISGAVEVRLPLPAFGSICCQQLEAGDWLLPQAEPFVANVKQYTIRSLRHSTFMLVPQSRWERMRRQLNAATIEFEDGLLARVSVLRRDVARLAQEAELRVVHYLFTEQVIGNDGAITLNDTFQHISRKLNLAPPTLSRVLRTLQESGFLMRDGRRLQILQRSLRAPRDSC